MSNSQRIGLYLTEENIILAESNLKSLQKVVSSPIVSSLVPSKDTPFHSDVTEEVQIISTFQRLLRENKIEEGSACVSIPIKEVFLRSFTLPSMPASELNSVVYYEAKKYIPFDLKLLDYVYQSVPFVENKQKRLRIIFYAIRKQTIEKYNRILKQTTCKPFVYEPSLVSLAKQLITKAQLRIDQKAVVVYVHANYGQIIFYDKGFSYFVREFSLTPPDVDDPKMVSDFLRDNILREVRNSLGYYSRQFSQDKIQEILVLATVPDAELVKVLTEELSVKVRMVEPSVTAGLQTFAGMDAMCACGACITKVPSAFLAFNFLQAKSEPQSVGSAKGSFFISQLLSWEISDFIYAIQAAVICILLLGGGWFYGRFKLQETQKQSNNLTMQQGELANQSINEIEAQIKKNKDQLSAYNKILKNRNHISSKLINLTKALPEGAWLEGASFFADTSRTPMELKGYIYSPGQQGTQFKLVNDFLARLKKDKDFSSVKLKLKSTQEQKINDHDAVHFLITGS